MSRFKMFFKEIREEKRARRDLWMFCTTITMGVFIIPLAKFYLDSVTKYGFLNPKSWIIAFSFVMAMFIVYLCGLFIFTTGKKIFGFQ